jgi:hypothetical protein
MSDEIMKSEGNTELPAKVEEPKQPQTKMVDFGAEIEKLLPLVGTIQLSDTEKSILYAPVDENLVEIRTDGLVYLPWMHYVTRLRNALGISWGLIPVGFPKTKGDMVLWPHWFIIRGVPVSFVIGEQLWDSNNKRMSWSDASEGARSNALMRACKSIGITLELWDPAFIRQWISKFATQVPDPKKPDKIIWVKSVAIHPALERGVEKMLTPEDRLGMEAAEAVKVANELFPGSEVIGPTGSHMPPTEIPEGKPADTSPSATLFVKYHDDMVRFAHISILRDWWLKNGAEAELKLHPNHFKLLVELKDKLRQGFIDKAMKEKGGK